MLWLLRRELLDRAPSSLSIALGSCLGGGIDPQMLWLGSIEMKTMRNLEFWNFIIHAGMAERCVGRCISDMSTIEQCYHELEIKGFWDALSHFLRE